MKLLIKKITLPQSGIGLLIISLFILSILRIISIGFLEFNTEIILNLKANYLKLIFLIGLVVSLYQLYLFTMK